MRRGEQELGIKERTGAAREELARGRGAANVSLAEQESNLRWQVGSGMAPQQIGVGTSVHGYNQSLIQQRISNAQNAMNAPLPFLDYYQRERMAQPTRTVTSSPAWGPQLLGGILGMGSMGANMYSGIASAGALRSIASSPYYQERRYT
jgi:hypothetical protein